MGVEPAVCAVVSRDGFDGWSAYAFVAVCFVGDEVAAWVHVDDHLVVSSVVILGVLAITFGWK